MNGPNSLSMARIALAPFVAWSILADAHAATVALLGLALATDLADGWWARRAGLRTELGKALDPIADKVLAAFTLSALVIADRAPLELAVVVVLRDLTLLAFGWLRLRTGHRVPAAELPGKVGFGVLGGWLAGVVVGVPWPGWAPAFVGAVYVVGGLAYAKRIPGLPVAGAVKGQR